MTRRASVLECGSPLPLSSTRKGPSRKRTPLCLRRDAIQRELEAVNIRLRNLRGFVAGYVSREFLALPLQHQALLRSQQTAMELYACILEQRLKCEIKK